jgi:amino acid permease
MSMPMMVTVPEETSEDDSSSVKLSKDNDDIEACSSQSLPDDSTTSSVAKREADFKLRWKITSIDVWALGITIVIGGQYFSWNAGLTAGFGSFAIAMSLTGCAYICLCLCVAELSGTLPFAGKYDYSSSQRPSEVSAYRRSV